MNEGKTERFYNQKTMVTALVTVSAATYLMGKSRGTKHAYVEGLKDGIKQGIAEGRMEGYVAAISDVASVMRHMTEQ